MTLKEATNNVGLGHKAKTLLSGRGGVVFPTSDGNGEHPIFYGIRM